MNIGQKGKASAEADNTVAASLVSGVLSAVELLGLDVTTCLGATDIDSATLETPTNRVDFANFTELLSAIRRLTDDDGIGIRIGRELAFSSYNALGYAAANEKTLLDALLLLPRYEALVVSLASTELVEQDNSVEVRWSMAGRPYLAILEGLFFASWITLGKLLAGTDTLTATVHLTHRAPDNLDIWRDTFGSNILFNQPVAKFIFSKRSLALPIVHSDPFIHQVMTKEADSLAAAINTPSLATRVSTLLLHQLPLGEPDQRTLACMLNMSERTLRRYLQHEDTTYQEVLDSVRKERATYYLNETSLSMQEIATRLGYRHLTAFNAAYKRWMGTTPGSARS